MRKPGAILVLVAALLVLSAAPSHAWSRGWHGHPFRAHHSRVIIGFGPAFWWGPSPFWWHYPPAYVYAPPAVVVQEPPVYVQQPPAAPAYWYYCPSAKGYYPYVQACPEAWIKVPPRPQQ
jgi:hypothetical protein